MQNIKNFNPENGKWLPIDQMPNGTFYRDLARIFLKIDGIHHSLTVYNFSSENVQLYGHVMDTGISREIVPGPVITAWVLESNESEFRRYTANFEDVFFQAGSSFSCSPLTDGQPGRTFYIYRTGQAIEMLGDCQGLVSHISDPWGQVAEELKGKYGIEIPPNRIGC